MKPCLKKPKQKRKEREEGRKERRIVEDNGGTMLIPALWRQKQADLQEDSWEGSVFFKDCSQELVISAIVYLTKDLTPSCSLELFFKALFRAHMYLCMCVTVTVQRPEEYHRVSSATPHLFL